MAEDVGDIYVDAHVDTKSLDREMKTAANRAGRDFGTYFTKSMGSELDTTMAHVGAKIRHNMAANGKLSAIDFSKNMKDLVQKEFRNWDLDLSHAVVFGDWGRVLDRFDDVEDGATRVRKRLRELNKETGLTDFEFDKAVDSMAKWVSTAKVASAESASLARTQKSLRLELERQKDLEKSTRTSTRVKQTKALESSLSRVAKATKKSNDEEGRSFSLLGRLTGSRNNFLNIVGKTARVLENLPQMFSKLGGGFSTMSNGLEQAYSGLSNIDRAVNVARAGLAGMAKSLKGMVGKGGLVGASVTVGILAAALLGLGNLLTGVAAGISGLTGILTAFAASLTAALGGALLSVGPMLGAFATGIGGVTLAITQNQDAFKKAVGPLAEWAKEAGKIAGAAMLPSIRDAAKSLSDVLSTQLTPVLRDSATVVGEWAKSFADSLNSSEMKSNMKVFSDTWPGILENLGRIFTSVFEGLSGVFAAISPGVEKFTGLIADAADRFSDWANSAGGKNTIKDWFEGAWESASKLWDILSNVTTAIGNVFSEGKDTGDSFLDSLVEITDQFAKWTDSDEGRAAISDWFEDAQDLASTLADMIGDIAGKFDEWDTERNREDFNDILDTVSGIVEGVMDIVTGLNAAADWLADMDAKADKLWETLGAGIGDWISEQFAEIGDIWDGLTEGLGTAWENIQSWWNDTFLPWIQGLPAQAGGFLSGLWNSFTTGLSEAWAGVQTWWNETASPWLAELPYNVGVLLGTLWNSLWQGTGEAWTNVTTWWNETAVPWFQGLPERVGQWFSKMWGKFTSGIGDGWAKVTTWWTGTAVPWFQGLPAKVGKWFSNMWGKFTEGIGNGWAKVTKWWNGTAVPWFQGLPAKVGKWFSNMWGKFTEGIGNGWAKVTTWWNSTAVPWFQSLPDKVKGFFQRMWDQMVETAQSLPGKISSWWTGTAWPTIKGAFSIDNWKQLGKDVMNGLLEGIKSIPILGTAIGIGQDIIQGIKDTVRSGSPSKETMQIGRDVMDGLRIGMDSQRHALARTSQGVADTMLSNLSGVQVQFGAGGGMSGLGSGMKLTAPTTSTGIGPARISADGMVAGSGASKADLVARGRQVVVQSGAIQVNTQVADPRLVASQVLDRMATKVV